MFCLQQNSKFDQQIKILTILMNCDHRLIENVHLKRIAFSSNEVIKYRKRKKNQRDK